MQKALGKVLFGAAVLLASAVTASYAQNDSGTTPEHKGRTGWNGGDGAAGDKVEVHDEAAAKTQPFRATGKGF
jgi:hypothetical protein